MHRLIIALTTLLALTGAAVLVAYLLVFGAVADRAAQAVPAGTPMYVNVYLQPSTGQQMNLSRLMSRLPGFADQASLDEKIDQVAQNLLRQAGIDYRADVKPWLGDQVAIALSAESLDPAEADPLVLVGVTDAAAADASLAATAEANGEAVVDDSYQGVALRVTESVTWAILDDLLVIGPSAAVVREAIDTDRGDGSSLASSSAYREALARLPDDHLASVYVDLGAAAPTGSTDGMAGYSTVAIALVAEQDGLRLTGSAPFDREAADESSRAAFALGTEPSGLTAWMPEDTQASVVVFGVRQMIEQAESMASSSPDGQEIAQAFAAVRAVAAFSLGINVDTDLLPLLDREAALALTDLEGEPRGQLLLRPGDPGAAEAALDRLRDGLERAGASVTAHEAAGTTVTLMELPDVGTFAYGVADGVAILALSAEDVVAVLDARAADRTLARSEQYVRAFERAGDRAGNEVFVDVAGLVDSLGLDADLPADVRDILRSIGAFGLTTPSRDDHIEIHAMVTVE